MRAVRMAVLVAVAGCSRDAPPSPEASRPKPTLDGRIGTEHPVIVQDASAAGGWVAYCQARRDTDGDGRIEIAAPDCFGRRHGDELSPYLSLAPGQEEPIDAFVGAHPSGRYLAFVKQGRLWVVDARTAERKRIDLTRLGAQSADDDVTLSPPGIAFDPAAERLLFIRARADTRAVGLMDLATGSSREIYTTTNYISRAEFDGDRVIVYVVDTDTDGNGVLYAPRLSADYEPGSCGRGRSATFSMIGDQPTPVPIEIGSARPVEPEVQDRLPPCTGGGRRYVVSFAGGARLVASATVSNRFGASIGPLSWADADSDRPCTDKDYYSGDFDCGKSAVAPFCEVSSGWYGRGMWAPDRNHVWAGRERVDLSNPRDGARDWMGFHMDVNGTTDDDVWVARYDQATHWNGRGWEEHESPLLRQAVGIVAAPRGRAWVYREDGGVVGWDGRRWRELPRPTEARIADAQLVGEQLWVATVGGQVLRYDDGTWRATDGLPGAPILAMWLLSPSIGYATTGEGELWAWDGARWRRLARLVSTERRFAEFLLDVRAAAPDDVWVSSSRGRLFHWDGSHWTTHDSTLDYWDLEILGVWDDQVLLTHGSTVVQFRRGR